jgi:hypothetical protein
LTQIQLWGESGKSRSLINDKAFGADYNVHCPCHLQWLPKEPFSCKEDSSSVVSPSADPGGLQISSDPEDDH